MNWYDAFNAAEAALWWIVAAIIPVRVVTHDRQQRAAVVLASAAFAAFGVTDLLEIGTDGNVPLWLWGCKVACGAAILAARYTWLGWTRFRWRDREVLFGMACLVAVATLIVMQRQVGRSNTPAQIKSPASKADAGLCHLDNASVT